MKNSILVSLAFSLVLSGAMIGSSTAVYASGCKEADSKTSSSSNDTRRDLSSEKVEKEASTDKKEVEKETDSEARRPFHHTGQLENRQ